ncbi:MAG: SRPBCC domain-containing protein [bacterium]
MQKLHFSIVIKAPKEKVWNTMLAEDSYRAWTDAFMPGSGSYYVGDWSEGSKMLFLAPGETGKTSGMVSRIKTNRRYAYISIEHLGVMQDGVEDTSSAAAKDWAGALENYTFKEKEGTTEVLVDTDTTEEHKEMFQDTWLKALQKLKELVEK